MMTMEKINMQNKFSFGPSQEDEGRKKTVPRMEGSRLTKITCVQFTLNHYTMGKLLDIFDRFIQEHGSASIRKDQIDFLRDQLSYAEKKYAALKKNHTSLSNQKRKLESEVHSLQGTIDSNKAYKGIFYENIQESKTILAEFLAQQ